MLYVLMLLLSLFLGACSDQVQVGVDDFPNTISALKEDVFNGLASNEGLEVPKEEDPFAIDQELTSSARIALVEEDNGATSLAALVSDTTFWFEDTLSQGYIILVIEQSTVIGSSVDSLWILWTEEAKDTIADNEKILKYAMYRTNLAGEESFVVVEDYDGDREVYGQPSEDQKILFTEGKRTDRVLGYNEIVIGPGADGSFDGENGEDVDNIFFSGIQQFSINGILKNAREFIDADGDGAIVGPLDSSLVWINDYGNFAGDLNEDTLRTDRLLVWRFKDSTRNYVVDFESHIKLNARHKYIGILDSAGYSSEMRDSVWIREKWTAPDDTLKIIQLVDYLMYFDPDSLEGKKSKVIRFHWQRFDREGLQSFEMITEPDEPMAEGQKVELADVYLSVSTNDEDYEIEARLESGRLQGKLKGKRKGKHWDLDWNE